MLKRELVDPKTGGICTLHLSPHDYLIIDKPDSNKGRGVSHITADRKRFEKEVKKLERAGWRETPASLSRRCLVVLEKKKPIKFWSVELDGKSLVMQYGAVPHFWYPYNGTAKTADFETEEEACYEYSTRVNKKLKEGYKDTEPRKTEFVDLIENPPPKPKKPRKKSAPRTANSPARPAEPDLDDGLLRFEFADGKSQKFWEIELAESAHTVTFGRIGANGQSKTKEFADEGKARASAEKLIAEKTKKGYEFTAAGGQQLPAAPKKTAAAKQQTAKAAPEQDAGPEIVLDVTSEIDLLPRDWQRATFRKRKPSPLPEETPFDYDDCKRRITKLKRVRYRYPFHKLELNPGMSAEEAHYWWHALSGHGQLDLRQMASVPPQKITGKLGLKQARQDILNSYGEPVAVLPLYRLLGHDDFVKLVFSGLKRKQHSWQGSDATSALAEGFVRYVLPFHTNDQVAEIGKLVRARWSSLTMPTTFYESYPVDVYLAAAIGLSNEVFEIVSGWEDSRYGGARGDDWNDHYQRPQDLVLGLGSADLVVSHWQRLKLRMRNADQVRAFLACTELSALDVAAESICRETNKEEAAELVEALALVRAPEAAEPMLYCVQNSKAPGIARDWLDRYVGNAIAGLAATAGGRGKLAEAAVQYLRDAKRNGHLKLIKGSLKGLDAEAAQKVRKDVVDFKEKVYRPFTDKSTPKWLKQGLEQAAGLKGKSRPAWAAADQLPTLGIGEDCLNPDQVETVLQALQSTILPNRHPLLDAVKTHVDEPLRDAFTWRLFERWLEDGAASKQKWAMCAIGHFGGETSAFKLTPMVRIWPGESQHARAVLGLECLRGIGSDTALMQLNGIAQKLKFQGLKKKAREFMEEIAEQRGMSRSELEDLIVPDLDLDERGTRTFDFGERTFQFVLKPDLKPGVRDEAGKLRADLPKPAKQDDAAKAEQAIADWKMLKKSLREAIKIQVPRLEQAMVTGRRWTLDQFDRLLVRHPLMINFVRTLLWGGYDKKGKLTGTFRVTEEQDYADTRDEPCDVSEFSEVGIVHPLNLSDRDASAWGEVFSDYELASPFPQIGRATYALEKGEEKQKQLKRFDDVEIPATSLVGTLDRLGWARGVPEDGGVFHEHSKPFYGANVTAVLGYEIGVPIGYMEGWEDQKLTECFFLSGIYTPQMYPRHEKSLTLSKVDGIVLSEVIADLHVLASKGK